MRFKNVSDVAAWRLCLGCGACAYICAKKQVNLIDVLDEGIRPFVDERECGVCSDCLQVCPAYGNDHSEMSTRSGTIPELFEGFGPVLEVWDGYAADREIRHRGASGGVLTALGLYCIEREHMHGVCHVGADPGRLLGNSTRLSRSRDELLACTGSRYAPASACDSLHSIANAPSPCVFVGQPSEVTALRKAEKLRPELKEKVGLVLSFFCAGSPSRKGTLDLLRNAGLDPAGVEAVRYRGFGWPGMFSARRHGEASFSTVMSYPKSWAFLQKYRPYSIHLWPDNSGEDADITCGDPWYRKVREDSEGYSLLAVRTEVGRQILQGAMDAGYVCLEKVEPAKLAASQLGFPSKRGAVWGRVNTMRAFGLPVPKIRGYSLFANWLRLPLVDKLKSTLGTARRILRRKYFRPLRFVREPGGEFRSTSSTPEWK